MCRQPTRFTAWRHFSVYSTAEIGLLVYLEARTEALKFDMSAGAFGVDFSSMKAGSVEASLGKVSHGLLEHGVTAFCPTLVTSSKDYYHRVIPLMCPKPGSCNGAAVLGKIPKQLPGHFSLFLEGENLVDSKFTPTIPISNPTSSHNLPVIPPLDLAIQFVQFFWCVANVFSFKEFIVRDLSSTPRRKVPMKNPTYRATSLLPSSESAMATTWTTSG